MDDQVFSSQQSPLSTNNSTEKSNGNGLILGIVIFLIIAGVGTAAYFAGKNVGSEEAPTPTAKPVKEMLVTDSPTPSPSPTAEPTSKISGNISPSKKPTGTPTVTITPTPVAKSKILSSSIALDGFRSSNNGGNATLDVRAGRNSNLVTRGFVSFDISSIPSGATVTEATLRLYQSKIIGNPYTAGGALKVDHLTYGDSLDSADYGVAALLSNFATLTSSANVEWKDVIVTDRVKNDLSNSRGASQFRIHFTTELTGGDATGDFAYFESADNSEGTGNTPQLVVKYY